jgi:hypothetical protein
VRLILPVLLLLAQAIGGPTQVQDPSYPLRVRILERNIARRAGEIVRMWGRADLVDAQEQGFDFDSDCSDLFMVSHGDELYSARWKKQDKELEMLVSKIGTGKSNKCTLKADLKPFVYIIQNGVIGTRPMTK